MKFKIIIQNISAGTKENIKRTASMPRNDAFLWGSNSSHQLAEGSQEKILAPKKTSAFQDVAQMEAGQYCTFVIHESGHVRYGFN